MLMSHTKLLAKYWSESEIRPLRKLVVLILESTLGSVDVMLSFRQDFACLENHLSKDTYW
jgi:hypothetical protein